MSSRQRSALVAELGAAVRQYQRAVDALDDAVAAHLGINRTDLRCMDVLVERGQATPGYLAKAVGLTSGSVTAMLDRLERLGYVQRTRDKADRRRLVVRPAPQAVEGAMKLYGPLAAEGARRLARYTTAELELLIGFLRWDREQQETHADRIRGLGAARRPLAAT